MELHALGMLCGLGATAFAALNAPSPWHYWALACGFALAAVAFGPSRFPDPSWVGALSALAAGIALFRPGFSTVTVAWGGALAALWISVLQLQGLPFAPAVILAMTLPVVSALLARYRHGFTSQVLREEALVIVIGLGLIVAIASGVSAGWQSAVTLKAVPLGAEPPGFAGWMMVFAGACALLGGLFSYWKRR